MHNQTHLDTPELLGEIDQIIQTTFAKVHEVTNQQVLDTNWQIGKQLATQCMLNSELTEHKILDLEQFVLCLNGSEISDMSANDLVAMIEFYKCYPNQSDISYVLKWEHYRELLKISNPQERDFYTQRAISSHWLPHELKEQIQAGLFHSEEANAVTDEESYNKDEAEFSVAALMKQRHAIHTDLLHLKLAPAIKLPQGTLEECLKQQLMFVLQEIALGFMYAGTAVQNHLESLGSSIDMLFYHKTLRSYVVVKLVNLQTSESGFTEQDMLECLEHCQHQLNDAYDHSPIGITIHYDVTQVKVAYTLCTTSDITSLQLHEHFLPEYIVQDYLTRALDPKAES